METRHRLSALGGAGALGIRRGSLLVLSAGFLDTRRRARCCTALEDGAGRVLLDRARTCRRGYVQPCPALAPGTGRAICRCVLCAESLPFANRPLAERLCGTAGCGAAATFAALSPATQSFTTQRARRAPDTGVESHAGGGLAYELAGSGYHPLLSGRAGAGPR